MKLVALLFLTASLSATATAKSLSQIAKDFTAQDVGFMTQYVDQGKPFIVKSTKPSEIGYEVFRFLIDDDEMASNQQEFDEKVWEDVAKEAWESDGKKFGRITYGDAFDYVKAGSMINDTDTTTPEYKKTVQIFKQLEKFKDLEFIVGPVGATPCGDITLPGVLIIDLQSGEVFELSMDSSEC